MTSRNRAGLLRWTCLLVFALAIEGLARGGWVRQATLVPVSEMFLRLGHMVVTGTIPSPYFTRAGAPSLLTHIGATGIQVAFAFGLAVLVGIPAGIALWRFPLLNRILSPYLVSYYAVPIFALYPLFILLFGIGSLPIVLIGFCFGVVVILVNAAIGFAKVDGEVYPKVGRSMRLSGSRLFCVIYLPAATPFLFTGLKLGFIYATIGVIASEFIISTRGLGHVIDRSYRNFETANMYAGILLVVGVALVVNTLLIRIETRIQGRYER